MKKRFVSVGVLILVLFATGCQQTTIENDPKDTEVNEETTVQPRLVYGDIEVTDVERVIEENPDVVLLDVRTEEEHTEDAIPNSIVIPLQELNDRILELDQEQVYMVYCRSGNRSSQAMEILKDAGFTKLFHMKDGMIGYREAFPKE